MHWIHSKIILDAALNAQLLFDRCDTVTHVLTVVPVHHFIARGVHVCLGSANSRIEMVQVRRQPALHRLHVLLHSRNVLLAAMVSLMSAAKQLRIG
jgi:hypothetical protein